MSWVKITAIVFVLNFKNSLQSYVIPQPEIKVNGEGFSVSIPHVPGISSFTFNGNVNRELFGFASGDFAFNVKTPENGKWIFRDLHNKLKIGDVIYYRMSVVKNGLGYRLENGRFNVEVIHNSPTGSHVRETTIPIKNEDRSCLDGLLNLTHSLIQQQTKIGALELKIERMKNYIEQQYGGRKLIVGGKLPPGYLASASVSFILREKLDLNTVIVSAEKNADGSITFVVPTLDDKLDILEAATKYLVHSRIFIKEI